MGKTKHRLFVLEDEFHREREGEFETFEDALSEVRKRAELGWMHPLNSIPCGNDECQKDYCIIEYNTHPKAWEEVSRKHVMSISAEGVEWLV